MGSTGQFFPLSAFSFLTVLGEQKAKGGKQKAFCKGAIRFQLWSFRFQLPQDLGDLTTIIISHIIAITCTIIILPVINCPPGQCITLKATPIIKPARLSIKRITGYLKLKNMEDFI